MTDELKAYILVYSGFTRVEVRELLKEMPEIKVWRFDMPNSFYVISSSSAKALSKSFREYSNGEHKRFIFVEITENRAGWLPRRTWSVLSDKRLPDE